MRAARFACLICLLFLVVPVWGQQALAPQNAPQTPEQASQATALIQRSVSAQTGGTTINDVTLTGTVTTARGQSTESGKIVLTASAKGQTKIITALPSGTRTSFRDFSTTPRVGTSVGPDGVSTSFAEKDMMGPHPSWFFPQLIMASALSSSSSYAGADMGQETREGVPVEHLAIWQNHGVATAPPTRPLQLPGQQDLYLDPTTSLPLALAFNLIGTNPDKNITPFRKIDVYAPEEIRFSDYRLVQGRTAAFHIQVYFHKALVMDIQVSSVSVNTGAVVSAN